MISQCISLSGMSDHQRRVVERHLPLVHLTLRRHRDLCDPRRCGREPGELFQEGSLALMEAVRSHDPARHGEFAPFAMARIHYAISRYAHEQQSVIRVPFITQRRRKEDWDAGRGDRHRPDALPRVVSMKDGRKHASHPLTSERDRDLHPATPERVTIGELIRERYDRAMTSVVREMKSARRCAAGTKDVVERCAAERWNVPEPSVRTPIRQIAKSLCCSIGRITHCEERYRKKLAGLLSDDATYRSLRRLARARRAGMRHGLSRRELAWVGMASAESAASDVVASRLLASDADE